MMIDNEIVCGKQIQIDRSGQGHAWRDVDARSLSASVIEEIEGEILTGGIASTDGYVAKNGQHYRWFSPAPVG